MPNLTRACVTESIKHVTQNLIHKWNTVHTPFSQDSGVVVEEGTEVDDYIQMQRGSCDCHTTVVTRCTRLAHAQARQRPAWGEEVGVESPKPKTCGQLAAAKRVSQLSLRV